MAKAKLSLIELDSQSKVEQVPIINGQLIIANDTGNIYRDIEGNRISVGRDVITVNELPLAPILQKIYFLQTEKKFYIYIDSKWVEITGNQTSSQSDWNENNPDSSNYIQNRPFYEIREKDDIVVDTNNINSSNFFYPVGSEMAFIKISDTFLPLNELVGLTAQIYIPDVFPSDLAGYRTETMEASNFITMDGSEITDSTILYIYCSSTVANELDMDLLPVFGIVRESFPFDETLTLSPGIYAIAMPTMSENTTVLDNTWLYGSAIQYPVEIKKLDRKFYDSSAADWISTEEETGYIKNKPLQATAEPIDITNDLLYFCYLGLVVTLAFGQTDEELFSTIFTFYNLNEEINDSYYFTGIPVQGESYNILLQKIKETFNTSNSPIETVQPINVEDLDRLKPETYVGGTMVITDKMDADIDGNAQQGIDPYMCAISSSSTVITKEMIREFEDGSFVIKQNDIPMFIVIKSDGDYTINGITNSVKKGIYISFGITTDNSDEVTLHQKNFKTLISIGNVKKQISRQYFQMCDTKIDADGLVSLSDVKELMDKNGSVNLSDVENLIEGKKFVNTSDVESLINKKGFVKLSDVEKLIDDKIGGIENGSY